MIFSTDLKRNPRVRAEALRQLDEIASGGDDYTPESLDEMKQAALDELSAIAVAEGYELTR